VALVRLLGRDDFPAAELGDSDQVTVGDWCFAVGNPFLLAHDFRPTVTYGLVSGVHRYQEPAGTLLEYADCIQTDAAINPGNSGGPLFNADGQLIGINGRGSFEKRGRVNVGVGYAISINQIKNFLGHLKSGRIVDHATWGATVATDETGRVVVTNILPSSDAYRRGIRYGDQIVSFGNRTITSANNLKNVLGTFPHGWRIPVSYLREDQLFQTTIRLTGVHAREELLELISPRRAQVERRGRPGGSGRPGRDGPPDPDRDEPGSGEPQPPDPPPPPPSDEDRGDGSENVPRGIEPDADEPNTDEPNADEETDEPNSDPSDEGETGEGETSDGDEEAQGERSIYGELLPPEIAAVYEARYGFSNYYFNRSARDRLWELNNQRTQLADRHAIWTLAGRDDKQAVWRLELEDERWSGVFGGVQYSGTPAGAGSDEMGPPGSGGLGWAVHHWRRWLVFGPERFGDAYYLGIEPIPGTERQMHVIVATADTFETRLGFDTESERLVNVILSADDESDPCELKLSDEGSFGAHSAPSRWDVFWGDRHFGTFTVESFAIGEKG
jgi:hypothetical protein